MLEFHKDIGTNLTLSKNKNMKHQINKDWRAELHGDLITVYNNDQLVKAFTVRMNDAVDHFKAFIEKATKQLNEKSKTNG